MAQFSVMHVHFKTPGKRPNRVQDFFPYSVDEKYCSSHGEMDSQIGKTSKMNFGSFSK